MGKISGIDPRTFDSFYPWPRLGMDEVGTGCVAGPVCTAGVVLRKDPAVPLVLQEAGLRDSKEMTPYTRNRVFELMNTEDLCDFAVVHFVYPPNVQPMKGALDVMFNRIAASFRRQYGMRGTMMLDGDPRKGLDYKVTTIQKGDTKSLSIAAASVAAKVSRDRYMTKIAEEYPEYGFDNHKGYLTRTHRDALEAHGPCDIHRLWVKPIRALSRARQLREEAS
jgi:ribonuclease HII